MKQKFQKFKVISYTKACLKIYNTEKSHEALDNLTPIKYRNKWFDFLLRICANILRVIKKDKP